MAEAAPKGFGLALSVAVAAIFLGAAAIGFAYVGASAPVSSLQSQISSLQSQVSALPNSLQIVNQAPQTRNVIIEWEATLPTLQDRWFPQVIVVNQGDTLNLTVESNDTDGAHSWTISTPTGLHGALQETQLNVSWAGQWMYFPPRQAGPQFGTKIGNGSLTGCMTMGQSNPCNTVGGCSINGGPFGVCTGSFLLNATTQHEVASLEAHVTIGPLLLPGVYKYFCYYHQAIGMVGYLIVLPNKAFTSP